MKASRIRPQPPSNSPTPEVKPLAPPQSEPVEPVLKVELVAPPASPPIKEEKQPLPSKPTLKPEPTPIPEPKPTSKAKPKQPLKPKHHWHWTIKYTKILIGCLLVGIIATAIALSYNQAASWVKQVAVNLTTVKPSPKPAPKPSQSPEPTLSAEQTNLAQKALAQAPDTLLYYAYRTVYNTQHVFESDPSGQYQLERQTGFADVYKFLSSPDGHYLVRWTKNSLDIASPSNIESFSQLAKVDDPGQTISSVVWANDSSAIAFATVATANQPGAGVGSVYRNRIYTVAVDGQHPAGVVDATSVEQYQLKGYNPGQQRLAWITQGTPASQNLSLANTATGEVIKSYPELANPLILPHLVLSSDLSLAYFFQANSLVVENLTDQTVHPLHAFDEPCPGGAANQSSLIGPVLSPDNHQILVSASFKDCPKPSDYSPSPTPPPATSATYTINSTTGSIEMQTTNSNLANLDQAWWSPDNKYIWMVDSNQQGSMFDSKTLAQIPFFSTNTPKQRVYFMAWLAK